MMFLIAILFCLNMMNVVKHYHNAEGQGAAGMELFCIAFAAFVSGWLAAFMFFGFGK